jgi:hypothetical protein
MQCIDQTCFQVLRPIKSIWSHYDTSNYWSKSMETHLKPEISQPIQSLSRPVELLVILCKLYTVSILSVSLGRAARLAHGTLVAAVKHRATGRLDRFKLILPYLVESTKPICCLISRRYKVVHCKIRAVIGMVSKSETR